MIEWLTDDGPKKLLRIFAPIAWLVGVIELLIYITSKWIPTTGYISIQVADCYTHQTVYAKPWVAELQHWVMVVAFAECAILLVLVLAVFWAQSRYAESIGPKIKTPTFPSDVPPPEHKA